MGEEVVRRAEVERGYGYLPGCKIFDWWWLETLPRDSIPSEQLSRKEFGAKQVPKTPRIILWE